MSWRAIRWAMEAAQGKRLTSVQRLVLLTLAYHHNEKTGQCTPSVDTIAAAADLSDRSVERATKALAQAGMITVSPRTRHGIRTSNQYDLFADAKGRTSVAPKGRQKQGSGGERVSPKPFTSPKGTETNVVLFASPRKDRR